MERHPNRKTDGFESFFVFKYDKEFRIGEKYIYKESKNEINEYTNTDRKEIVLSENTKEKKIESDNRKELEERHRITEFKYWKKMEYSLRYSISDAMYSFTIICFFLYEWYKSNLCYGRDE